MRTYPISDGDTLVLSVNGCAWQTVTFQAKDFAEAGAATAEEVAEAVRKRATGVTATAEDDVLVLATEAEGNHAELRVEAELSTTAAALGLAGGHPSARGSGLEPARLIGEKSEPFDLEKGAGLTLWVDGKQRHLVLESGFKEGKATAAEVVEAIGAKVKRVACATLDGRVMLVSPTVGVGSALAVEPPRDERPNAALALGFTGAAASSRPYASAPARLRLAGPAPAGSRLINHTASPIELHLPTGTVLVPARGGLAISPADLAHPPLQRLLADGTVGLAAATAD